MLDSDPRSYGCHDATTRVGVVRLAYHRDPDAVTLKDLREDPGLELVPYDDLPRPIQGLYDADLYGRSDHAHVFEPKPLTVWSILENG